MTITDRIIQLDRILDDAIASFDIPDSLYRLAVRRYGDVGERLSEYWSGSRSAGTVYPQGSFRLGTVVRPITPADEYDIDLVCRRQLLKESVTQADLKADVGKGLKTYVGSAPEGTPALHDGKRCWTLDYPADPFHIDVLPAIPDVAGVPNAILLTTKDLREWQHSNPIDYSEWFYGRMAAEFKELRERVAVAKAMDVDDVPDWSVKTTLQRTVQALKRHRDLYFQNAVADKPASIIITTLAARSYVGGGSLYEVLLDVTGKMPGLVERRNSVWWVANPVQREENFADRWRTHPNRAELFFDWITRAREDVTAYRAQNGVDILLRNLAKSLGEEPARTAGAKLGSGLYEARRAGQLGLTPGSGILSIGATRPIPRHTFHGGDTKPRET